ncbi:MAG TPA: hypothetical protein VLL77_01820 [Anaerolineales bacterium]|nr:hypothetical protein [Anaerolineales bacterium]
MEVLIRNAALSAYLFAVASILSTVTLMIMFAGVGIFGPINDLISVFQFLFLIPVALATHQALRPAGSTAVLIVTIVGVLAMLVFAVLQSLLVVGVVRFEQTLGAVLAMGALIGLWLAITQGAQLSGGQVPTWLGWVGILGGLSFVLTAIGWFFLGGMQHPLVAVGFLIGAILLPAWGIGTGRLLSVAGS